MEAFEIVGERDERPLERDLFEAAQASIFVPSRATVISPTWSTRQRTASSSTCAKLRATNGRFSRRNAQIVS